jgi:3',5'-cyclic AMP phosphodiesterase CpdA
VAYAGADSAYSNKSLKTVSSFPSQWSVVHITDPHVTAGWDTASAYAKELEYLSPIVSVINVLSPDIVICTGDNVMDYLQNGAPPQGEKWNQFFNGYGNLKGVHGVNSPVFVTTGNHDAQYPNGAVNYSRQWTKWVGKRYHALSFGFARFLGLP